MLADTAVAVNPADERFAHLIGQTVILPLVGRELPVIGDDYVKTDFGTGCLKITPGHDPNDFEIGRRHGLGEISVIGEDGRMNEEAGEYAGEAMLPFTAPGGEIFLAYAVDLGVKVTEETTNEQLLVSVNIANGLLSLQEYQIQRVTYRVENRNDQAVNVTLEHPRLANYTPFDTPDPVETTADAYRYLVQVKAHSVAVFTAAQRRLVARREEVRNQRFDTLQRWLRDHLLDQVAFDRIKAILALHDRLAEHETSVRKNETNRQAIFNQQKVVQGNLGALKEQGEEGQLRGRYVRTLNQLEDQLAQLKTSDDELAAAIARTSVGVKAGGVTRMVSIVQSITLLVGALFFGTLLGHIPLSALSGVLFVTAWRMNEWHSIRYYWNHRLKGAVAAFFATMLATIALDLTQAILIGSFVAGAVFLSQIANIDIDVQEVDPCLLYTSPSPRDRTRSRMPSSA